MGWFLLAPVVSGSGGVIPLVPERVMGWFLLAPVVSECLDRPVVLEQMQGWFRSGGWASSCWCPGCVLGDGPVSLPLPFAVRSQSSLGHPLCVHASSLLQVPTMPDFSGWSARIKIPHLFFMINYVQV